ncbi:MAG: dicarboxylate/amino acid:cation symporter [Prosthecochloris sp.]|nr:dicarboxylate/amino acid:cation symporter [Prosthecochloris sp.]
MHQHRFLLPGILGGIVSGILLGGFLPEAGQGVSFVGDLFIRVLTMLVVPLIIAAMITGISRLGDVRRLGPLGTRTLLYYLSTTAIAVTIGIVLVLIIEPGTSGGILQPGTTEPGNGLTEQHHAAGTIEEKIRSEDRTITDLLKEVISGMVPTNLFRAMANNDILPVIAFSLLLGGVLTTLGTQGKPVLDFFSGLNEALMKIIHLVMLTSPVGIGALVAGRLGEAGGFSGFLPELLNLAGYAATVIAGLMLHSLVVLPLLLKLFGRISPLRFAAGTTPALLTAFSTASSSASLPVTIECAEENNGVSPKTAGFVLPMGATINMDGTALYEAVAVIFIAQMNGIALSGAELGIVFLTATLAAIGAAGIPEAGLVTMVLVLKAVNLPLEGISLILAIDWFLDRCRTTVNVWGDSVGARIIDKLTPDSN